MKHIIYNSNPYFSAKVRSIEFQCFGLFYTPSSRPDP